MTLELGHEAAARIKVSKTALYAVLKASQPDTPVGLGRATGNGNYNARPCTTIVHGRTQG
ncbi:hypothetical protein HSBAA_PA_3200 (plasmid) [Vreelandella sulfidaeris]|uniref:Uncharacterized protein n=1 Tax=Vreelandella sulfidaeris TaxID=115553 RepID=A0A455UJ24_9GAMM|nr:hypothetical protein HSBAA_PA_3200 [Halomonas sulfidaeris]